MGLRRRPEGCLLLVSEPGGRFLATVEATGLVASLPGLLASHVRKAPAYLGLSICMYLTRAGALNSKFSMFASWQAFLGCVRLVPALCKRVQKLCNYRGLCR